MTSPMNYPQAYIDYLVHLHAGRDFFECHEILEDYWREEQNPDLKKLWHGMIQIAVALYHERRGNVSGALKVLQRALKHVDYPDLDRIGIDGEELLLQLNERKQKWLSEAEDSREVKSDGSAGQGTKPTGAHEQRERVKREYTDLNMSFLDTSLKRQCIDRCRELGLVWGSLSDMRDDALINKHLHRDRTGVEEERHAEIERRKRS